MNTEKYVKYGLNEELGRHSTRNKNMFYGNVHSIVAFLRNLLAILMRFYRMTFT